MISGISLEVPSRTEEDREFLEHHNLLAAEETLQQIYEIISDKPEKMVRCENALL